MDNTDNWLSNYTNDVFVPAPSPPVGAHAAQSSASDDSPIASTSTASTSQEEAPRAAVKDKKRRACDACRIRRIRCQRTDARLDSCDSCVKMDIRQVLVSRTCLPCWQCGETGGAEHRLIPWILGRMAQVNHLCVESKPKARTSQKGARIAQAKLLYGDASSGNAFAIVVRNNQALQEQSRPRTPSATEILLVASVEAGLLLNELVPAVAKLKIARFPLLRWIEIANEFRDADGRLSNMDGVSQALFLSLAALGARTSRSPLVVGDNAPTLQQVSQNQELRQGSALCVYGNRRERVASEMLQVAYRKINENQLFAKPSLRSVATLATVEMLILVYQDSLAFTRTAAQNARPLSAAVASHLRIMAEESNGQPTMPFGFYSVAWTALIRDALLSSVTGRALDFTTNDVFMILKVDEDEPIDVPSPQTLLESWLTHPLEGPILMQLWACVLKSVRKFVNDVTQPLAAARPRLKIHSFDMLYSTLKQCRESFAEAIQLLQATTLETPEQKRILQYCIDFMLAQAHRIVAWRCSEEQLARARTAPASAGVIQQDDFETYKSRLQSLRVRSAEEAFQAARRVIRTVGDTFAPETGDNAEFFVPGYFIYEGLLVWTSLLIDTRTIEEGGRIDYSISDKISDLKALREGIAITGWSSGLVQPHLDQLNNIITSLERQQRAIMAPPMSFFSEYVNMSPTPQASAYATPFHASEKSPDTYVNRRQDSSPYSQARIGEILQGTASPDQWLPDNNANNIYQTQSEGVNFGPGTLNSDQLSSAEYIDQFLRSIGFSNPIVDDPQTSSL